MKHDTFVVQNIVVQQKLEYEYISIDYIYTINLEVRRIQRIIICFIWNVEWPWLVKTIEGTKNA